MLELVKIGKRYEKPLFENINVKFNFGDKVCIIGDNGVGKSTLLKIINNEIWMYEGKVVKHEDTRVGYLHQGFIISSEKTLWEEMQDARPQVYRTRQRMDEIEKEGINDSNSAEYFELMEMDNALGINQYEKEIAKVLVGFGFSNSDFEKPVNWLSGGEKFKVAFSKLLLQQPEILLLDEPTNHLDIETIKWLENYLTKYKGCVIFISHDVKFIDNLANKIFWMDVIGTKLYKGNYTEYVQKLKIDIHSHNKQVKIQQKYIKRMQDFIEKFQESDAAHGRIQDRKSKMRAMKILEKKELAVKNNQIDFATADGEFANIITMEHCDFGYDGEIMVHDVNMELSYGEKISIIGRNGIGKSTIIKTVMGITPLINGKISIAEGLKITYINQDFDLFDKEKTAFWALRDLIDDVTDQEIENVMYDYYLDSKDIKNKVKNLSGGEKAKLALVYIALTSSHLLILDEPTNHLDIPTKEMLKATLSMYDGSIIVISHDRDFMESFTDKFYQIENEKLSVIKNK